jgi:hypothetical protein
VAPPGNQAANGENKPQPKASGETCLLDNSAILIVKRANLYIARLILDASGMLESRRVFSPSA